MPHIKTINKPWDLKKWVCPFDCVQSVCVSNLMSTNWAWIRQSSGVLASPVLVAGEFWPLPNLPLMTHVQLWAVSGEPVCLWRVGDVLRRCCYTHPGSGSSHCVGVWWKSIDLIVCVLMLSNRVYSIDQFLNSAYHIGIENPSQMDHQAIYYIILWNVNRNATGGVFRGSYIMRLVSY